MVGRKKLFYTIGDFTSMCTSFITDMRNCIMAAMTSYAYDYTMSYEPWHGISNNVVCATSKASDQPAHTRSLIRAFAS